MTFVPQKRMSLEEFLTYDDGTDRRYELVDGVLVEMGAESPINSWIAGFMFGVFLRMGIPSYRLGFKHLIQVNSPYVTARDPDLIVHSEDSAAAFDDGRKEACLKLNEPNPLIAIEIVSPGSESSDNYQRDYKRKPVEYADRGIPEMWLIDPERGWVKIGTLVDGEYQFQDFTGESAIVSLCFPCLSLTAAQVLKAGR
ncbi:MAG: Uma2 family endonuclease [Alkalinema sp. RU_4_3]|nr:Uma2 family endonuclease [Alkalinema sp. RU_4_3]